VTARIFISYRTSDGVDKATALARDLNAAFGDDQVFLDKEDLAAGAPWREAIGATMSGKPVLLLLITPQLLGPRLADANDPVRREIAAALDVGAHLIPLLADGVDALPPAQEWPAELHGLSERTWRRLRAYDWREDVERLVADLQALGVARRDGADAQARSAARRRGLQIAASFALGAMAGGAAVLAWSARGDATLDAANPLAGTWTLAVAAPATEAGSRWEAVTLHVTQAGEEVKLYSEPIDITRDPAWSGFAKQWQERFGQALERVVWRGAGRARLEQGSPPSIDVGLRVETPAGGDPIETGNLSAELAGDGQRMAGRVWMNSEQAERAASLIRRAQ
jgi:TIR domain